MVQSLDLTRISTVKSTDFMGQSSDLVQRIYLIKSSGRSEEFIYFVWMSVWQWTQRLPFTQSLHWQTEVCRGCSSEHRSGRRSVCFGSISLISTLFIQPHHEILPFGVQCSDFLINPWVNPQIAQISLNPLIYQIYLSVFNFPIFNLIIILNLNLVIWIFEAKSWDLFIKSQCPS